MSDRKPFILGDWLVSPVVVLLSMAILIVTAIAVTWMGGTTARLPIFSRPVACWSDLIGARA